jgi:hypothetical protein
MGIFKERAAVMPPKMKITIPTAISSVFNLLPPFLRKCCGTPRPLHSIHNS